MIYNKSNIIDQFRGLIGFKPSYDRSNSAAKIEAYFSESLSGEYINELHSLFTAENFANCAQQFQTFSVEAWSATATYKKNAVAKKGNVIYQALADSMAGTDPAMSPMVWRQTTLLTIWLQEKYDAAVLSVISLLEERKKLEGNGKQLRGNTALYNSEGLRSNVIAKSGRFLGFEINVSKPNISAVLQRIGMQLSSPAESLPIHVMYNGEDKVINMNFSGNSKFNYSDIPPLGFMADNGSFIIGYYEDDLPADSQAIQLYTDVFSSSCATCSSPDSGLRKAWSNWVDITAISMVGEDITTHTDTNWGLNLVFSFRCDLSDILIQEKLSLTDAIKAQLRISLMDAIGSTVRNNGSADQASILAYNQLRDWDDPDNPKIVRDRAIKALDFNFSGISAECMPCNSGVKIKVRTQG